MRRSIGMVFQQFNLWPHMTALQNVAEGLQRVRGMTRAGRISQNHAPLSTFLVVAALYFVISYPLSLFGRWYERRLA